MKRRRYLTAEVLLIAFPLGMTRSSIRSSSCNQKIIRNRARFYTHLALLFRHAGQVRDNAMFSVMFWRGDAGRGALSPIYLTGSSPSFDAFSNHELNHERCFEAMDRADWVALLIAVNLWANYVRSRRRAICVISSLRHDLCLGRQPDAIIATCDPSLGGSGSGGSGVWVRFKSSGDAPDPPERLDHPTIPVHHGWIVKSTGDDTS
jgi:hypothetical protein